jgi:hypothetical protein
VILWLPALLLAWTHALYGAALRLLPARPVDAAAIEPQVSLVIAAYAEEAVIAAKIANALALDYPRERLELIVACDGSPDATAALARRAGADVVLELPRGGKIRAQDAAVAAASSEIVAFSDANALWAPDALRELVKPFADPAVGYVCGQVAFVDPDGGGNQEGLYWRYEMAVRALESSRWSVTGGNGAIYATRRNDYIVVDEVMGHDLSFPFNFVKRGRRAVFAPAARATERMVPTVEGEYARKRRMMSHAWPIVVRGGLLDPRGYPPVYAGMIASHRALRYASPLLHAWLLLASLLLAPVSRSARLLLAAQLALLLAAAAGRAAGRAGLIARYYVLTTASIAGGLLDWVRHGTPAGWDPPEGTRDPTAGPSATTPRAATEDGLR